MATKRKMTLQNRADRVANTIGYVDTERALNRLAVLAEGGETGGSILARLNPPAVKPKRPELGQWFVGDSD